MSTGANNYRESAPLMTSTTPGQKNSYQKLINLYRGYLATKMKTLQLILSIR